MKIENIEKIMIATSTINLLATQLHTVYQIKKCTKMLDAAATEDDVILTECVKNLLTTLEELGNAVDNNESFSPESLQWINESFDLINDRGSSIETKNEEIERLMHALELIASFDDDNNATLRKDFDEVYTIAHDAINFKK